MIFLEQYKKVWPASRRKDNKLADIKKDSTERVNLLFRQFYELQEVTNWPIITRSKNRTTIKSCHWSFYYSPGILSFSISKVSRNLTYGEVCHLSITSNHLMFSCFFFILIQNMRDHFISV